MPPPQNLSAPSLIARFCGPDTPAFVPAFHHTPGTRVIFGPGEVARTGILARNLKAERVLVVTDPGIANAGHLDRVVASLSDAGLEWSAFMGVIENPTTDTVAACVESARSLGADLLIGLGGGSSMDTAKGCNFILTNGGVMHDYWGSNKASHPMLPSIAIPTTAGTGSECQSYALISDAATHAKMACGDRKAAARIAILDPDLTLSLPPRVTALTGIDAVAHAVESAVSRNRNDISLAYSLAAFPLLTANLPRALANPSDLEARSAMLLGAALAGTAIENSMLGAAHSACNPLTARFDTPHGEAVGLMLPHVVRLNSSNPDAAATYNSLCRAASLPENSLADFLASLFINAGFPPLLPPDRLAPATLDDLSTMAAAQWTAQFNPVPVTKASFDALYRAAAGL
jgi:alcohol dehydrogenase